MKVCMITREFPPNSGGIGSYVYNLSRILVQKGHTVFVITRGKSRRTKIEHIDGVTIFQVPFIPLYPIHIFLHGFHVNNLLRSLQEKIDIIHLHSPLPPPIKTSLPVITTFHSPCRRAFQKFYRDTFELSSLAEQLQTMIIYPFIESRIIKLSCKITTVSQNVSEEMRLYGLNPKTITVIGNAVDTNFFVPKKINANVEPYVLFVGILRSGKGVLDLVDIAKYVCDKRPDVRFIVCGDGPLLKMLRLKTSKMELSQKIIFIGFVDRSRIVKFYQNAMLLVQPSAHEGLSTVVLEAMSCGVPVIAFNIPGNRQVITSGLNGILVSPPFENMSESILKLLNDGELRQRISRLSRTTIENNFTWDIIADKTIECYNQILKKSS